MISVVNRLDKRVQRWIFKQGWSNLREIQAQAIEPVLSRKVDVLISASTAAGKTEAFFLPACSSLITQPESCSAGILYISPLKALINDQYRRLESLSDETGLKVTAWHGDSPQSQKAKFRKSPSGILLTTPESLESLMIRESSWLKEAFSNLAYVVIDEFHAFIGTERGMQLLSLLNRLEHLLGRLDTPIPRVALSATLGNIEEVPKSLRPNLRLPCELIVSSSGQSSLKTVVKGFVDPDKEPDGETVFTADEQIAKELFELCRGDSHLVFTNSRKRTEYFSSMLTEMCENQHVPNEFFPHHGSLSRELRETLESRLQDVHLPTTAICTMTLELGIDVGKVNSVVQVSAPHSVSSLRQRMGRSGRRGGPSILRGMIAESELTAISDPIDRLRIELVQTLAMFRLLIGHKWYEPADTNLYHFSTLLHQILAVTAQWGGTRADQLYHLLCMTGPFQQVSVEQFKALLVHLGAVDLLTQLSTGELVLGVKGEKLVSHYTFYSVFTTPEEFRILVNNKVLGTLPMDSPVIPGLHIIFGGRYWKVLNIDIESKTIQVEKTKGGNPPKFGGRSVSVHPRVRKEMLQMYRERDYRIAVGENRVEFIDKTAKNLFEEAIQFFRESGIADHPIQQYGKQTYIFTWQGDKVVNTLVAMLIAYGLDAGHYGGIIEINNCPVSIAMGILGILKDNGVPSEAEIASTVPEKVVGKYDELLPENILCDGYGNATFDSQGAMTWLNVHI